MKKLICSGIVLGGIFLTEMGFGIPTLFLDNMKRHAKLNQPLDQTEKQFLEDKWNELKAEKSDVVISVVEKNGKELLNVKILETELRIDPNDENTWNLDIDHVKVKKKNPGWVDINIKHPKLGLFFEVKFYWNGNVIAIDKVETREKSLAIDAGNIYMLDSIMHNDRSKITMRAWNEFWNFGNIECPNFKSLSFYQNNLGFISDSGDYAQPGQVDTTNLETKLDAFAVKFPTVFTEPSKKGFHNLGWVHSKNVKTEKLQYFSGGENLIDNLQQVDPSDMGGISEFFRNWALYTNPGLELKSKIKNGGDSVYYYPGYDPDGNGRVTWPYLSKFAQQLHSEVNSLKGVIEYNLDNINQYNMTVKDGWKDDSIKVDEGNKSFQQSYENQNSKNEYDPLWFNDKGEILTKIKKISDNKDFWIVDLYNEDNSDGLGERLSFAFDNANSCAIKKALKAKNGKSDKQDEEEQPDASSYSDNEKEEEEEEASKGLDPMQEAQNKLEQVWLAFWCKYLIEPLAYVKITIREFSNENSTNLDKNLVDGILNKSVKSVCGKQVTIRQIFESIGFCKTMNDDVFLMNNLMDNARQGLLNAETFVGICCYSYLKRVVNNFDMNAYEKNMAIITQSLMEYYTGNMRALLLGEGYSLDIDEPIGNILTEVCNIINKSVQSEQ